MMFKNISKKAEVVKRDCCGVSNCDESFHSFLEDQDKKKVLTNRLLPYLSFPVIYLLASILMPITLLIIKQNNKLTSKQDITIDGRIVTCYFDLINVNQVIYKAYCCISSLSGIVIVLILFTTLNQRFKVPEFKDNTIRLHFMMLFGMASNLLLLYRGFFAFFKANIIELSTSLDDHPETLFIAYILFSIFFSIYSLTMLDLLRTQRIKEDYWYIYRVILVSFLSIFTIIYTSFLLYKNHYVTKYSPNADLINHYMGYVLAMFPYFIHSLNAMKIFSYYFEIKYLNAVVSRNLDVDYLFESEGTSSKV
jgi:hypothetical protein